MAAIKRLKGEDPTGGMTIENLIDRLPVILTDQRTTAVRPLILICLFLRHLSIH